MANASHHAPTFIPYPFRPFWQPNSQPFINSPSALHQDVTELSQNLDTAEKKILEYAQLIASLYAELKGYQGIVCHTCKENLLRTNLAATSPPIPAGFTESASQHIVTDSPIPSESSRNTIVGAADLPRTTLGVHATADFDSSLDTHDQSPGIGQSVLIHPPDPFDDPNPNDMTTSSPQRPATTLDVSLYSADTVSEPPVLFTHENTTTAVPTSDWSVEYNPEVKQSLSLHVAKTFTFSSMVLCTKFSCDGKYLAMGLSNGEIHVYNMTTESTITLENRIATVFYTGAAKASSQIWSVNFSPDNKFIVTGSSEGQINLWEFGRGRLRASFKHGGLIKSLDFSPDGRFLVSAYHNGSVRVWRTRDGSMRTSWHEAPVFLSSAFSPDGRYVAAGHTRRYLHIWVARTGRLVAKVDVGDVGLMSVIFTSDGKGIAGGTQSLHFWDVSWLEDNRLVCHRIKDDNTRQVNKVWKFDGHEASVTAISFSPDTRWIVSGSLDHNLCVVDARNGDWLCTLKGHTQWVWSAEFSPAGQYIASGGEDRRVRLWRYEEIK